MIKLIKLQQIHIFEKCSVYDEKKRKIEDLLSSGFKFNNLQIILNTRNITNILSFLYTLVHNLVTSR